MTLELVRPDEDEWTLGPFSEEVFPEATMPALLDAVWALNIQIHKIRARRDHLQGIVLRHCLATGQKVEGKKARGWAQDYVAEVHRDGSPRWEFRLEVRKR